MTKPTSASPVMGLTSHVEPATLPIVETFHSVQGEGFWVGANAYFMRLAGCDVGCPWCDTKHSWNPKRHPRQAIADLVEGAIAAQPAFVVITGGEPLMHDLTELTDALHHAGLRIHLETSGSHPWSGRFDWVTLSPKPFKPPLDDNYVYAQELKVVVQSEADIAWAEQQAERVSPQTLKYLQPEWSAPASQQLVFEYVLRHSDWRVSLQTHKYLGIR